MRFYLQRGCFWDDSGVTPELNEVEIQGSLARNVSHAFKMYEHTDSYCTLVEVGAVKFIVGFFVWICHQKILEYKASF